MSSFASMNRAEITKKQLKRSEKGSEISEPSETKKGTKPKSLVPFILSSVRPYGAFFYLPMKKLHKTEQKQTHASGRGKACAGLE